LLDEELRNVEKALPGAFDLAGAVNGWTVGEAAMERLGIPRAEWNKPDFNLLRRLGFSRPDINDAEVYACGAQTLEGAPYLKIEHYPVFDTANRCGKLGQRFIEAAGHLRMMAAAQPFVSGAISKTINLPADASVDDVRDAYDLGWKLGLKAVALYRDGCKASQPLSSKSDSDKGEEKTEEAPAPAVAENKALAMEAPAPQTAPQAAPQAAPQPVPFDPAALTPEQLLAAVRHQLKSGEAPLEFMRLLAKEIGRRRLPNKRFGFTQKAKVAGHTIFVRTGEYEDGALGEIFVDMHKEGAAFRSLMNCFAIAVSIGLQYGVPLEEYVEKFTFTRFEPAGFVDHPNIKQCASIVDYIFRLLGMEYLGRTDFVQVPPVDNGDNDSPGAKASAQLGPSTKPASAPSPAATASASAQAAASASPSSPTARPASPSIMEGLGRLDLAKAEGAVREALERDLPGLLKLVGNGTPNGASTPREGTSSASANASATAAANAAAALQRQMANMQSDAPICGDCGSLMRRSGACYVCPECGAGGGCG
jgi:ribonucleoside-diphosphate reductase alpha chain